MALCGWMVGWELALGLLLFRQSVMTSGNSYPMAPPSPGLDELLGLRNYKTYKEFLPDSISDWRRELQKQAREITPRGAPRHFVKNEESCRWFFIMDMRPESLLITISDPGRAERWRRSKQMEKGGRYALRVDTPARLFFILHGVMKGVSTTFQIFDEVFCGIRRYESNETRKLRLVKWVIDTYRAEDGEVVSGDGVIVAIYTESAENWLEMQYVLHFGWKSLLRSDLPYRHRIKFMAVPRTLFSTYKWKSQGSHRVWERFERLLPSKKTAIKDGVKGKRILQQERTMKAGGENGRGHEKLEIAHLLNPDNSSLQIASSFHQYMEEVMKKDREGNGFS